MACRFSVSVAVGFELNVRSASYLVCHRWFGSEDNIWDLVTRPWVSECLFLNSLVN